MKELGIRGRHAVRQLLPLSATAFVPLSPTPRSAGGERAKRPVAVSRTRERAITDGALGTARPTLDGDWPVQLAWRRKNLGEAPMALV